MDYYQYQSIRAYCWRDMRRYIDTPNNNLALELAGDSAMARIEHEHKIAMGLFDCIDLTPQENAAAHLLAIISNARLHAWQREPNPPDGNEPAPPLEKWQAEELARDTRDAVEKYAVFLSKRKAAALRAMVPAPAPDTTSNQAAPPASEDIDAAAGAEPEAGEPPMRIGSNPATAYVPWIAYQAPKLKQNDDIRADLATRIVALAKERHYSNQGGNAFVESSVVRLIPAGTTGTRAKNGRKNSKK